MKKKNFGSFIGRLISTNGVTGNTYENRELSDLMSCCNAEFQRAYRNVICRHRILWELNLYEPRSQMVEECDDTH